MKTQNLVSFRGQSAPQVKSTGFAEKQLGVRNSTSIKSEINDGQSTMDSFVLLGEVNQPGILKTPFGRGEDDGKAWKMGAVHDTDGTPDLQVSLEKSEEGENVLCISNGGTKQEGAILVTLNDITGLQPGDLESLQGNTGISSVSFGQRGEDAYVIAGEQRYEIVDGQFIAGAQNLNSLGRR